METKHQYIQRRLGEIVGDNNNICEVIIDQSWIKMRAINGAVVNKCRCSEKLRETAKGKWVNDNGTWKQISQLRALIRKVLHA